MGFKSLLFSCILLMVLACQSQREMAIRSLMQRYDQLILNMDGSAIAALYLPDGRLLGENNFQVKGPQAIEEFLSSFKNVKVLSNTSTTESIVFKKDTAIQRGFYRQSALINGKDTIYPKGNFVAKWVKKPGQGWRIASWGPRE